MRMKQIQESHTKGVLTENPLGEYSQARVDYISTASYVFPILLYGQTPLFISLQQLLWWNKLQTRTSKKNHVFFPHSLVWAQWLICFNYD
jgi:hypothetical protein